MRRFIGRSATRSCSAARRGPSPSPTARSRRRSRWAFGSGFPAFCCGRPATPPRSGPPSATPSSSMWCGGTCSTRPISDHEEAAMMNLAEYRKRPALLADYLPWAALVAKGVVLNKDGSFQRTARFRGPDLDSATPAELVGTTARLDNALRRLGSGWALFVEAQRTPAQTYPHSHFPDPVSALVDLERGSISKKKAVISKAAIF